MKDEYKIVTIKEFGEMLMKNKAIDFTFDENLVNKPEAWYGAKIVNYFGGKNDSIIIGYYGGGVTIARYIEPKIELEKILSEMLLEISDIKEYSKVVCIDMLECDCK